jgi:Ca-activated chloride channel family protein
MNWWDSLIFADKWVLWFLPAIPVLGALIYFFGGKGRPVLRLSSFGFLKGIPVPSKVKWRILLPVLRLLALVLLITAFARPQSRDAVKHEHGEGIDIMLSIDISPSMDATDLDPSRIGAARIEATHFIDSRPDDRIGVVIFSGETFTLCPLTSDHEALKSMIMTISTGDLDMGTAIGMGLAKAVERIKMSTAKSKVVILLTDGENNCGTIAPLDAGRLAKTFGVRVYTIGLSTTAGQVLTPTMQNPDGSYVQQYQPVDIDESTLQQIATMTGGKYFRAGDTRKLEMIYSEIDKLEKSEFDKKGIEQRQEEFLPFLVVALLLILLEFTLRYTTFDSLT